MVSRLRSDAADVLSWAARQGGVLARGQLLELGYTPGKARAELKARRWVPVLPGVYAVATGPLSDRGRLFAAWLYAGEGAVVAGRSALWWVDPGRANRLWAPVEIDVPRRRRVVPQPGLLLTRRDHPPSEVIGNAPLVVRPEFALLDAAAACDDEPAVTSLVFRVVQRRLARPECLARALAQRRRHPWRALLGELLVDARDGVQSPLERRYVLTVQRRHGLPEGSYNHAERDSSGRRRFRDVEYGAWRTVVELDGREFHDGERAFRDRRRDNRVAVSGRVTLRYGWQEVVADPCGIAAEVGQVLRAGGWTGTPRPCSPACALRGRSVSA